MSWLNIGLLIIVVIILIVVLMPLQSAMEFGVEWTSYPVWVYFYWGGQMGRRR